MSGRPHVGRSGDASAGAGGGTSEKGGATPVPPRTDEADPTPVRASGTTADADAAPAHAEGAPLLDRIVGRAAGASSAPSRPQPGSPAPQTGTSLVERSRPLVEVEGPPEDPRAAGRTLFHRFALELEMAESRQELVDVVASVDRYVDEVLSLV